jgi:hypothetical protein
LFSTVLPPVLLSHSFRWSILSSLLPFPCPFHTFISFHPLTHVSFPSLQHLRFLWPHTSLLLEFTHHTTQSKTSYVNILHFLLKLGIAESRWTPTGWATLYISQPVSWSAACPLNFRRVSDLVVCKICALIRKQTLCEVSWDPAGPLWA